MNLIEAIRSVPDFPKKGIVFRDITTLLKNPTALREAVELLYSEAKKHNIEIVAGIESRGFILGGILAHELGVGFVPIRKPGKLPAEKLRQEYSLEYGTDAIEIHRDAILPGTRVLLHDDLLATGGTMAAACKLVEGLGGKIAAISFLIELSFLNGRQSLAGYDIHSLIQYQSE
ncbi:MAG: adenine phosphoribosyltransferase [Bacteroidota bacterium]